MSASSGTNIPNTNTSKNVGGNKKSKKPKWQPLPIEFNRTENTSDNTSNSSRGRNAAIRTFANQASTLALSEKTQALVSRPYRANSNKAIEFDDLDQDIKFIIYDFVCQDERVLEIQWDGPVDQAEKMKGTHYYYRPTTKARKPPAIIQVNKEARWYILKKKKYYQVVNFASLRSRGDGIKTPFTPNDPVQLYYNSKFNIIYFGANTCLRPIIGFCIDMKDKNLAVSKVTLIYSGKPMSDCSDKHNYWDIDKIIYAPDEYTIDLGHYVAGGITPIQAIHGLAQEVSLAT